MPGGWIKCPRCELNYIREGEEYCAVCMAELKKGPQLIFAVDDDDDMELEATELCPICHQNYIIIVFLSYYLMLLFITNL
jgi:hypothetical protein